MKTYIDHDGSDVKWAFLFPHRNRNISNSKPLMAFPGDEFRVMFFGMIY